MHAPSQKLPVNVTDGLLSIWFVAGILGTVFIADDAEDFRFVVVGWLGVPAAIGYLAMRNFFKGWQRQKPRLWILSCVTLATIFAFGVVPLVNAATATGPFVKRTVARGSGIAVINTRRGGLGWLFRTRSADELFRRG